MQNPITKKSQQGFTLIELLIVVAIIGILAAIAIPQYAQYRVSAMNSAAESELKNIQTSQEGFYSEGNYHYTNDMDDLAFETSDDVEAMLHNASSPNGFAACTYHSGGDKILFVNSTMTNLENVHNCTAGDCSSDASSSLSTLQPSGCTS